MPGKINTDKQMRERPALDFYETPYPLARYTCERLSVVCPIHSGLNLSILDAGAGTGVYGRAAREIWPLAHIVGIELDDYAPDPAYDEWVRGDFIAYDPGRSFDYVIGNPPYSLAEPFVRKGYSLLKYQGALLYLLKLDFLAGIKRMRGLHADIPPCEVWVCATRPSFYGNGRANAYEFASFLWRPAWNRAKVRGQLGRMETSVVWTDWRSGRVRDDGPQPTEQGQGDKGDKGDQGGNSGGDHQAA